MKYLLIAIGFILISKTNFGQKKIEEIVNVFFKVYKEKGVNDAIDNLFTTNNWMLQESSSEIENVKLQLKNLTDIAGKYYGFEKIATDSVGENLILLSFLVKYERLPIRFLLTFYRPENDWIIYNFKFDQKLNQELEESVRLYRSKGNI